MIGRVRIIALSVLLIIFITPVYASARTYIGDELPASEYQIGNGINIEEEVAMEQNMFPGLLPEQLIGQCTWLQYPDSSYCFRSAPSQGKGMIDNALTNVNSTVSNHLANCFFSITKWCAYSGNNIMLICFDDYFLRQSLDVIAEGVREYASPFIGGDQQGLSGMLFSFSLIILAIGIVFYILRAQLMKAITSLLLSAVCIAFLLIYASNVHQILPPVLTFVNDVTGIAITSVSFFHSIDSEASHDNVNIEGRDINRAQESLVGLTNEAWFVLVTGPWANGQFGTSDYTRLRMTEEEKSRTNAAIGFAGTTRRAYTRNDRLKSDYIDTNYLASSEDVKDDFMTTITDPYIYHGQHEVTIAAAGAGSGWKHFAAAFLSILPALIYIVFVVLVGLPVFIAQFLIMGIFILLPVALILGIAGENGRAVLVKSLKALLGFLSTKVIYGFYLGFAVMLAFQFSQFATRESKIGTAGFIVCVILAAATFFRKKFFNACMSLLSFAPGKAQDKTLNTYEDLAKTLSKAELIENTVQLISRGKKQSSNNQQQGNNQEKNKGSEPSRTNRKKKRNESGEQKNGGTSNETEDIRSDRTEKDGTSRQLNQSDANDDLMQNNNGNPMPNQDKGLSQKGKPETRAWFVNTRDGTFVLYPYADEESSGRVEVRGKEVHLWPPSGQQEQNQNAEERTNSNTTKQMTQPSSMETQSKHTLDHEGETKHNPVNIKPPWQNANEKTASETSQEERKQQDDTSVTKQTEKTPEKPNITPADNTPVSSEEEKSKTVLSQSVTESQKDIIYTSPVNPDDNYQTDYLQDENRLSDLDREPLRLPGSRWYD